MYRYRYLSPPAETLRQTDSWVTDLKTKVHFIEPMLAEELPQGGLWMYELKLDGFRAEAIKSSGRVHLRPRNDKGFSARYPAAGQALAEQCPMKPSSVQYDTIESPAQFCHS